MLFKRTKILSLFAVFALLTLNTSLAEDAKIKVGTLTCEGKGSIGLILGSKEKLSCSFSTPDGTHIHSYDGTITRVGLDIGVRGESVMIWTVLGSTSQLSGEALGGTFAGVSADVAAGIGAGANVLLGGNKKSIILQPLSVSGGSGVNIAVGVSGLKLVPIN